MDFVLNGQGHGNVAATLIANGFDVGCLRPWLGNDGRSYMTIMHNGELVNVPIGNAIASLRKDEWIYLDTVILRTAKQRLRAVADLRGAGLTMTIPNAMGKTSIEYQTMGDITPATISMDPVRQSEADRPLFDLKNLPLPIIHKDFHYTARQIAVSRNGGTPLDTTTAELAGRRVAEEAEKLLLGISGTYEFGGGTIYGYTNYPSRNTHVLTNPTAAGWTPGTLLAEVLAMKQKSMTDMFYGPWVLYNSPAWDEYLDNDYSDAKGDNTLRERLRLVEGINDIRTLDYLTGYQLILVQLTSDVVREVVGMDITTVQWETHGGMLQHFKVMAMLVPQLRADMSGNCGIVHGTAP